MIGSPFGNCSKKNPMKFYFGGWQDDQVTVTVSMTLGKIKFDDYNNAKKATKKNAFQWHYLFFIKWL